MNNGKKNRKRKICASHKPDENTKRRKIPMEKCEAIQKMMRRMNKMSQQWYES